VVGDAVNRAERDAVADQFGVSAEQVERDHLISHLLSVLSAKHSASVHLIGGTALSRTHLPAGRLSEDIDLVATASRRQVAAELDASLPRSVARTHGRLEWAPALSDVTSTGSAFLRSEALSVRVQLLSSHDRVVWPHELRDLEQRYSDAPGARLQVPTLPSFAAGKTATWQERHAPRDLWDLWAMTRIGAIDDVAAELYRKYGPTNRLPARHIFDTPPTKSEWHAQLAGQTRLTIDACEALATVRDAWADVCRWTTS
jgi:predicted nucleotidyltransferase component of viral defense system